MVVKEQDKQIDCQELIAEKLCEICVNINDDTYKQNMFLQLVSLLNGKEVRLTCLRNYLEMALRFD